MQELDKLQEFIQAEVKRQVKESKFRKGDLGQYTTGRYGEVRKKYTKSIIEVNRNDGFSSHIIVKAIRDIAKASVGISYMSKATDEELNKMIEVYEVIAKAYLAYKESEER